MKLRFIFTCLMLFAFTISKAETGFANGTNAINLGLGLGGYYGGYYSGLSGHTASPVFSFSFEHGQWDAGPGVISWGAYAGYKTVRLHRNYNYGFGGYSYTQKWNYIILGARAAWHYTELPVDKLDLYGGVMAGLYIETYSYSDNDPGYDYDDYSGGTAVYPSFYVGARYWFASNVGAFAEAGYGASFLSVGISFKF